MQFNDFWTIFTGVASVFSLFIAMSDKFPQWKKYIYSVALLLGGFAVGRLSYSMAPSAVAFFEDPKLFGFILIILLVLVLFAFAVYMMFKRGQDWYAYLMICMVMPTMFYQIMNKYTDSFVLIPKEDYLVLANIKEKNSDIGSAIRYLEKFREVNSDKIFDAKLLKKISKLKNKQLIPDHVK